MRKRIIATVVLLLFAKASFAKTQNNLSLSYRQLVGSKVLEARIRTQDILYDFEIRQYRDGYFKLQAPPFLVVQAKDLIHIGELRPDNLLRLITDPMTTEQTSLGHSGNNLQHISNPTQNPSLSGIALTTEHIGLYSFTPVFNPQSPLGQAVIAGNRNAFAGILHISADDRTIELESRNHMLEWSNLNIGKRMLFTLFGANASISAGKTEIESQIFLQNAWDPYLGGGTTTGFQIRIINAKVNLNLDRRSGGKGVHLAKRENGSIPQQSFRIDFKTSSGLRFSYSSDLYPEPVYGGTSQMRDISFTVGAEYGKTNITALHERNYEKDRGIVSYTVYTFRTEYRQCILNAGFTVLRNSGREPETCGFTLDFKAPNSNLEIQNGKTTLELSWKRKFEDCTLTLSVNQDRYVRASLSMEGF